MTDQELRAMIRESIDRHLAGETVRLQADSTDVDRGTYGSQASFARLPLLRSGDDDGACLIEPTVRCNHCGYCLSYGH
jgi:hypothetical protein